MSDLQEVAFGTRSLSRNTFIQSLLIEELELSELYERHGMDIYVPIKYVFVTTQAMFQPQAAGAS